MRIFLILLLITLHGCATGWRETANRALEKGDQPALLAALNEGASAGDHRAIYGLGILQETGVGMKQDRSAAVALYTYAARMGSPEARLALVRLGEVVPRADLVARPGPSFLESLGAGMQGAGAVMSPDVYNAQRGLPPSPATQIQSMDFKCLQDCGKLGYSGDLCRARCSY